MSPCVGAAQADDMSRAWFCSLLLSTTVLLTALVHAPATATTPTCPPSCTYTFLSTLRIDATVGSGTIVATDAHGATAFTCPPSNDWCTHTDTETTYSPTRPTSWPSYTLSAPSPTGPTGTEPVWSTCGRAYTCAVTNNQPSQDVVLGRWADIQAPTVSLTAPAVVGPSTVLTASVSDNVGISEESWSVYHHGADTTPLVSVAGENVPSFSPARPGMAPGSYDISFTAWDDEGNTTTRWVTVALDESVSVNVSAVAAYTRTPPAVRVSTDDDATATCTATGPGASVPAAPCGTTFAPSLGVDGSWTYTVKATDGVGNTTTITRSFVLDTARPVISVTGGPANGAATFSVTQADANPGRLSCGLDVVPQTPCNGAVSFTGLADGDYLLTAHAVDLAGNESWATRRFTVKQVAATAGSLAGATSVAGSVVQHGSRLVLRASVPPGSAGTVTFSAGRRVLCRATVVDGRARCTARSRLVAGTRRVKVTYSGDATHRATVGWIRVRTPRTGTPR